MSGKAWSSPWGLLAPLTVGLVIESIEIWTAYKHVGLFAPGNDQFLVIVLRHAFDVLAMFVVPALLVAFTYFRHE